MGILVRNSTSLSDLNLSFEIDSNTGDLNKMSDDTVIRRALENLLTTAKTEKPFRDDYGSDLKLNLFEVVSHHQLSMVESQVVNIIERGEPRITVHNVNVDGDLDNHYIEISIEYMINKTSEIDRITTMLSLSE